LWSDNIQIYKINRTTY